MSSGQGIPIPREMSAGDILRRLTGAATLAAGALLYGQTTAQPATLTLGGAGQLLTAGASAPAWSGTDLTFASGVLTIAGSEGGTPAAGEIFLGGGQGKFGAGITCKTLTASDGSAAAPAIRTLTEATGLYRASSVAIGFAAAGVSCLVVSKPLGAYGSGFQLQHSNAGDTSYIYPSRNDGRVDLYGGTGETTGAHVRLYGYTHETKANFVEITNGNTVIAWSTGSLITIAGSAPGTPSSGQVLIGGGEIKTKGAITAGAGVSCTTLTATGTGGVGYATGAGGAVEQTTGRTTGVTLNKTCGAITLVSAAGSTSAFSFTVTNSTVAATDTVRVCQKSGTDKYIILVTAVAAGSFEITAYTTGGTTTEQPVFSFAVIKAVAA